MQIEDPLDQVEAFYIIAFSAIKFSHHEIVQEISLAIEENWVNDFYLQEVAERYLYIEQVERAIALLAHISDPAGKVSVITKVIEKLGDKIIIAQIQVLLQQAENHALIVQRNDMKAQALRQVAQRYTQIQQFEKARILLQQAQQIATALNAEHLLEQAPRDAVLNGIIQAFGQLKQEEGIFQTAEAMTDKIISASTLSHIAQAASDDTSRIQAIQALTQAEEELAQDNSPVSDLRRVHLAEAWSQLKMFDQVQAIAEKISDPILKELALRYAGIGVGESEYDKSEQLCSVCRAASEQDDFDEGQKILLDVLEQIFSRGEDYRRSLLQTVIESYFALLAKQ